MRKIPRNELIWPFNIAPPRIDYVRDFINAEDFILERPDQGPILAGNFFDNKEGNPRAFKGAIRAMSKLVTRSMITAIDADMVKPERSQVDRPVSRRVQEGILMGAYTGYVVSRDSFLNDQEAFMRAQGNTDYVVDLASIDRGTNKITPNLVLHILSHMPGFYRGLDRRFYEMFSTRAEIIGRTVPSDVAVLRPKGNDYDELPFSMRDFLVLGALSSIYFTSRACAESIEQMAVDEHYSSLEEKLKAYNQRKLKKRLDQMQKERVERLKESEDLLEFWKTVKILRGLNDQP